MGWLDARNLTLSTSACHQFATFGSTPRGRKPKSRPIPIGQEGGKVGSAQLRTFFRARKCRRMLDFGWHLRGSVPLRGQGPSVTALDSVERMLESQRKTVSERGPNYLVFNDPLWSNLFGPNWLAMVIYDHGRFWIEQSVEGQRLRYDLRSLHGMVFCLFVALMILFFGLAGSDLFGSIRYAAGAFAWLYGMNIALALVRVPTVIRKAVQTSGRNVR